MIVSSLGKYKVSREAMRPASNRERCFYCKEPVEGYHKEDCVLVQKKVKVRMIVEYEIAVPAHWTESDIEFHRNDSSWCCGNAIDELQELDIEDNCLCGCTEFECLDAEGESYLDES